MSTIPNMRGSRDLAFSSLPHKIPLRKNPLLPKHYRLLVRPFYLVVNIVGGQLLMRHAKWDFGPIKLSSN